MRNKHNTNNSNRRTQHGARQTRRDNTNGARKQTTPVNARMQSHPIRWVVEGVLKSRSDRVGLSYRSIRQNVVGRAIGVALLLLAFRIARVRRDTSGATRVGVT